MHSGNVLNAHMQSILVYDNDGPRGKYDVFSTFSTFFKC